ncbi:MAG: LysR family transcriptional regulator [Saccharospirillaceae bacterium]|nr:LysR family transcriptional regulator [Pseudomonadales bacterium]NRB79504.1 LysR family transcriptional regulator [Saccharospirillaceae bacterium]
MNNELNWQWLQIFVVVAQEGSFSKAAKRLNQSQPTISRQIQHFEKHIDTLLFHRTPQGLTLTDKAHTVYEQALKMQVNQDGLLRQLNGRDESLKGSIRISVNEVIGFYTLPKIISAFSKLYPEIQIELVITNQSSSLSKREADLALRMYQPTSPDLIAQKVGELPLCLFASPEYLKEHHHPKDFNDILINHKLIGFDKDLQMIEGFKQKGLNVTSANFAFRCDHLLMQIQMIQAGCGIGVTHKILGHKHNMIALFDGLEVGHLPLWVVCHQEVKFNKKLKVFKSFLIDCLKHDPYALTLP